MDVQISVIDGCPKSDIWWTSISCPWTYGHKMDTKWMSI